MAQHDYVIANGTGAAVRSDLNNALAAIVSQNSGATAPSPTYAFQFWADTTAGVLKLRNSANSAWITLFQLDGEWTTLPVENGTAAAPSIYFKDSGTDTGFYSPGTDQVAISTGGTGRLFINSSGSVGIGTSSPSTLLHLNSATATNTTLAYSENGTLKWYNRYNASDGSFQIVDVVNSLTRLHISNTGNVGIGTTNPTSALHIDVSSGEPLRFRSQSSGSNYLTHVNHAGGDLAYVGAGGGAALNSGTTSDYAIRANQGALLFGTNGNNERARIDTSGRLLVNTSSARSNLYIGGTAITPPVQIETSGSTYSSGLSLLTYSASNYAPVLTIGTSNSNTPGTNTAVGNNFDLGYINFVGNDGTNFRAGAYIYAQTDGGVSTGDLPTRLVFSTTADGASSPTERMRIRSDGAFTLSDNATLDPIGSSKVGGFAAGNGANSGAINYYAGNTIALKLGRGNDGAVCQFFRNQPGATSVGDISVTTTATTYNSASDYRLKENIVPLSDGIIRLMQLKPSRFNFIVEPDVVVDGFIAHEAQEIVPQAVTGTKDAVDADGNPIYQGIDQSKLVPLLTAALQEAVAKIESLEARLTAAGI